MFDSFSKKYNLSSDVVNIILTYLNPREILNK